MEERVVVVTEVVGVSLVVGFIVFQDKFRNLCDFVEAHSITLCFKARLGSVACFLPMFPKQISLGITSVGRSAYPVDASLN